MLTMSTPPASNQYYREMVSGLFLLAAATICYWLYIPALDSPLMFDDISNLSGLKTVHSFSTAVDFMVSGQAGPLGRPISLASFLINSSAWPSLPATIKHTNVLIHLLNGLLLAIFALRLGRLPHLRLANPEWFTVSLASLWMLHPLLASTSLIIIQRMTSLMATFLLIGFILYISGRSIITQKPKLGITLMSSGVVTAMLFGTLSKENATLFPLYVLALEYTLLHNLPHIPNRRTRQLWTAIFIALPLTALITYFLYRGDTIIASYEFRPFELSERLLTECNALLIYLRNILLPIASNLGPFYDDFPISHSILQPITTLPAVIAIAILVFSAWRLRKKSPVFAFAVLWFLAGHSMESTFLSLELYFEHRNYLPSIGPLFAICYWAWTSPTQLRSVYIVGLGVYGLLLAFILHETTLIWGQPIIAAELWSQQHPQSTRAQQYYSQRLLSAGDNTGSHKVIEDAYHRKPNDTSLALQHIQLSCAYNKLSDITLEHIIHSLSSGELNFGAIDALPKLFALYSDNSCSELTLEKLHHIGDNLLSNPAFKARANALQEVHLFKAHLYIHERHLNPAILHLDHAFAVKPNPDIAILAASTLTSAGLYKDALTHLDEAMAKKPLNPLKSDQWSSKIKPIYQAIIKQQKQSEESF